METSTLTSMWTTRPPRIPAEQGGDAKIAGVCEGIGVRYQIDPTIVRVAFFIAMLFSAGGLSAYLLAWMFMPRYGMSTSPIQACFRRSEELDDVEKSERGTGWVLLIFSFLLFAGMVGIGFSATALIGVLILLAAWFGLHQLRPEPPLGLITEAPQRAPQQPVVVDLSAYSYPAGYEHKQQPPAWDPLGAAPFAWDLPDPGPAPEPPKKKNPWPWVLGIGAAGLLIATTGIGFIHEPATHQNIRITEESQLDDYYEVIVGSMTMDLRDLGHLEEETTVAILLDIGDVELWLPEDVPVELTCGTNLGQTTCEPGPYNTDAPGETLYLEVFAGIGDVYIHTPEQN